MPQLIVAEIARDDVAANAGLIAEDNLTAALRFYDAAERAFNFLAANPGAGPKVDPPLTAITDLRFWPITPFRNYLVFYRPLADGVHVLRVIHGARHLATALRNP